MDKNLSARIRLASRICELVGLDPNKVTRLEFEFAQSGETFIRAQIAPRWQDMELIEEALREYRVEFEELPAEVIA